MKIQHPHNNLFEKVMELKSAVKALIRHFFPKYILAELDLSTLEQVHDSFVTGQLAKLYSDTVYSCQWKGQNTYLSFLFEHKSKYEVPDLQLMTYAIQGYKKQQEQWQSDKEKVSPFEPTLIIPVLLYHGRETWQATTFTDLFKLPNSYFKDFIPSCKYLLIDLKQHPDDQLETIEMKILLGMLLLFKYKGDKQYVLNNVQKIFIFVEEGIQENLVHAYIKLFVLYIYHTFKIK
ncbi:MAG: Rpn family recombination-promoting nuclease/putative transposase, partial [Bacteroidota bacterium]